MKEIHLGKTGKNKEKYVSIVSDEDYKALSKYSWSKLKP